MFTYYLWTYYFSTEPSIAKGGKVVKFRETTGFLLNKSSKLLKRNIEARLQKLGLTTTQWGILRTLSEDGVLSQAEISDRLVIDRATCGTVLGRLIKKGLIEKELSDTDRRSYRVKILQPGLDCVNIFNAEAREINRMLTKGMTDEDVLILRKCIDIILANFSEAEV